MADPDAAVQKQFRDLSYRVKRNLAAAIREQADQLAAAIRQEAPVVTGRLRDSVRVSRGRNTLELIVEAGGAGTATEIRQGSGIAYDYSLAVEFGTSRSAAQPFFFRVYNERRDDIRQAIAEAVQEAFES